MPNLTHWPYRDHRGRCYRLEGGIGHEMNGTRARVWIWTGNREGKILFGHSIRLDAVTAEAFHADLGRAIEVAKTTAEELRVELEHERRVTLSGVETEEGDW